MPRKTVYVPRCGSQLSSSQSGDPDLNQTRSCPVQGDRDRVTRVRRSVKNVFKVKFPNFVNRTEQTKTTRDKDGDEDDGTQRGCVLDKCVDKSKKIVCYGAEKQCAGPDSACVNDDVFLFSQSKSSKAVSEKEKAKLSVLRNISRMLEENKRIRQRLVSLSQANCSSTQ